MMRPRDPEEAERRRQTIRQQDAEQRHQERLQPEAVRRRQEHQVAAAKPLTGTALERALLDEDVVVTIACEDDGWTAQRPLRGSFWQAVRSLYWHVPSGRFVYAAGSKVHHCQVVSFARRERVEPDEVIEPAPEPIEQVTDADFGDLPMFEVAAEPEPQPTPESKPLSAKQRKMLEVRQQLINEKKIADTDPLTTQHSHVKEKLGSPGYGYGYASFAAAVKGERSKFSS
jgi:hypothetical protein